MIIIDQIKRIADDYKGMIKVLLILNVMDLFTTIMFINVGYQEGNPVMKMIMDHNFILASILKLSVVFIILSSMYFIYERYSKHKLVMLVYKATTFGMVLLYMFVVFFNIFPTYFYYLSRFL